MSRETIRCYKCGATGELVSHGKRGTFTADTLAMVRLCVVGREAMKDGGSWDTECKYMNASLSGQRVEDDPS